MGPASMPLVTLDEVGTANSRTVPGIVLSCLFTLFTCISCCIRRDIPSPYDSKRRVFSTKFNILFWVLICPEVVALWALRQWFEAGKIAKALHYRGWTRRHGLFLLMGGFILCKDGQPVQTLSEPRMMRLLEQGAITFPTITTADIKEQSNLHPTFALLAFLQASWFVVECFSRFINGLLVTQLEIITLIHVFMNAITLIFTWQKPLNARYPISINPHFNLETLRDRTVPFSTIKDDFRREQQLARCVRHIFQAKIEPQVQRQQSMTMAQIITRCLKLTLIWPIKSLYFDCGRLLMNPESSDLPQGSLKVPLFYVPGDSIDMRTFLLPITTLGMGIGIVNYAIWLRGYFPSESIRLTWRVASLASTIFCAVLLILIILVNFFQLLSQFSDTADVISDLFLIIAICTFFIGCLPFILARIALLLGSFVCLRSLPQEALVFKLLTNFIPHLAYVNPN